jgi:hypothetical protein
MKKFLIVFKIIYFSSVSLAQTGGDNTFSLLNLPFNARSAALGTDFITVKDQDLNLAVSNPSLYNSEMHKMIGFSQTVLAGNINVGMLAYANKLESLDATGGISLRYVNYGKMNRTDVTGQQLGTFTPSEYILGAGLGKQLNPQISIGGNFNFIFSQFENYNSVGASIDLAATYELEEANLLITALVKNAGIQLKTYTKGNRSNLPAEFQIGVAHKLQHAPFRFSILFHNMNRWDLTYNNPNEKQKIDPITGDLIEVERAGIPEKIARHLTFQAEILISKNFHLRTAFDYHRRQEMKLAQRPGASGFSFGTGMYFKRFSLDYGFVIFSAAGFSNVISINTNFEKWRK